MDVGFKSAGIHPVYANDVDFAACKTYGQNLGYIEHGPLNVKKVTDNNRGIDVIFGGPPCQGFSVAGKMDPKDLRSTLVHDFMSVVTGVKPLAFACENVKALATLEKWASVRMDLLRQADHHYKTVLVVLNANQFGVPQNRERMFLLGFRRDICKESETSLEQSIKSLLETHKEQSPLLGDVIKTLGRAGSPGNDRTCSAKITYASRPVMRKSPYAGMMFNGAGRPLSAKAYASTLPASMGGNRTPFIDEHEIFEGKTHYAEIYHQRLMQGLQPLKGKAPEHLRRLTVDECLAIQTFPQNYKLSGSQSAQYRQIGNAVPCKLAEAVGKTIVEKIFSLTK